MDKLEELQAENKRLKAISAIAYEAICTGDQEASDKAIGLIEDFDQTLKDKGEVVACTQARTSYSKPREG